MSTFDPEKHRIIREWLQQLVEVLAIPKDWGDGEVNRDRVLTSYADFLYADFPSNVFLTKGSGHAIASQNEHFPRYAVLLKQLQAWRAEHQPPPRKAVGDAVFDSWSSMDRQWLAYWYKRVAENFGAVEVGAARYPATSQGAMLSLLLKQAPKVHAYVTKDLPKAEPVEDDGGFSAEATRATLRKLIDHPMQKQLLRTYRTLLEVRAPQFLPLLDEFEISLTATARAGPTAGDPTLNDGRETSGVAERHPVFQEVS